MWLLEQKWRYTYHPKLCFIQFDFYCNVLSSLISIAVIDFSSFSVFNFSHLCYWIAIISIYKLEKYLLKYLTKNYLLVKIWSYYLQALQDCKEWVVGSMQPVFSLQNSIFSSERLDNKKSWWKTTQEIEPNRCQKLRLLEPQIRIGKKQPNLWIGASIKKNMRLMTKTWKDNK